MSKKRHVCDICSIDMCVITRVAVGFQAGHHPVKRNAEVPKVKRLSLTLELALNIKIRVTLYRCDHLTGRYNTTVGEYSRLPSLAAVALRTSTTGAVWCYLVLTRVFLAFVA